MQAFAFSRETLLVLLLTTLLLKEAKCCLRQLKLYDFQTKLQQIKATTTAYGGATGVYAFPPPSPAAVPPPSPGPIKKSEGKVFYPIGYGADPSGEEDSTDAIIEALADASQVTNGLELLPGISDLGGVSIDLQGGSFKISSPIRFPPGIGNLLVHRGTLRASSSFPDEEYLIELWSPNSKKNMTHITQQSLSDRRDQNQNPEIYYEGFTFRDILFDSSYKGGGLLVVDSARIRVTGCLFIHFSSVGILVERGHETFISSTFLGQHPTVGGDPGERDFSGTGIDLAGNDNAVTDVTVFSAATGIIVRGEANILTGVHCYNKATYYGGVAILVKAAKTRIDNCYLDYNSIVIEDPSQVHVTNGFFLGDGNIVLKAVKGQISGLNVVHNMFSGNPKKMIPVVAIDGEFSEIDQVVVDQNNVNGMRLRSTVGKLTVAGNGTHWVGDFSSALLFRDKINHVLYSFYSRSEKVEGFPGHRVTSVSNNVVVVQSERVIDDGVVTILVDQYNMDGESNLQT